MNWKRKWEQNRWHKWGKIHYHIILKIIWNVMLRLVWETEIGLNCLQDNVYKFCFVYSMVCRQRSLSVRKIASVKNDFQSQKKINYFLVNNLTQFPLLKRETTLLYISFLIWYDNGRFFCFSLISSLNYNDESEIFPLTS